MDIVLILFLTFLSGVFSMTEIAVVSSRRIRIESLAEAGDKGALAVQRLLANPTQFFSTIQMGNTTIALLNGIVGEGAFGGDLSGVFERWGMSAGLASGLSTGVVVVGVTYITIVFGELVSKRIGQSAPESIARFMARPVLVLATAARPFVALLAISTNLVLRLLRISGDVPKDVTEAEIQAHLEEGVDAGIIEQHEHQMVRNVFQLDDRQLTSIMVPHADIEWLDAQDPLDVAVQKAWPTGHSWYPVCRGGLEDVVGVVHLPRLLALQAEGNNESLLRHVQPAVFVPETLSGMELLEQFRARATRMVFVVDEYGVVQGLLTPLDMLEAITGELSPEAAVDAWATQREDGAWLVDGAMPVAELKARLDIESLPDEDKGRYNTVAGLMQTVAGDLLNQSDAVNCAGWRFEVLVLDGRRIDQVLISRLNEAEAEVDEPAG
ncbi:MAG: hemolysin family protein [Hydrogenophaga sp.]|uniref:hemolysin family protein n=1 Tax=Hydrogenophaga sp. TaxID=1904254 RepID=UPI0027318869|nr:hemolysin family protein [Hydrogenophaga sp.]MDP2252385.1 hemolysin family protein [Hydrogenophaga sp.]